MQVTKERLTCKCGHVFDAEVVTDAPIAVWKASIEAIRCPACGGSKLGLGGAYKDNPGPESSVAVRAAWWLDRGEVGVSSRTMWAAFTGGSGGRGYREFCYPLDPDDYRRCRLLLDLIPEWRRDLSPVVARFPWMKPFVDRWDEFDRLWIEEFPKNKCLKLYALMKVAETEAIAMGGPQ